MFRLSSVLPWLAEGSGVIWRGEGLISLDKLLAGDSLAGELRAEEATEGVREERGVRAELLEWLQGMDRPLRRDDLSLSRGTGTNEREQVYRNGSKLKIIKLLLIF